MLIIFQARDSARNGNAVEGLKLNSTAWRRWTENNARVATTEQTSAIEDYVVAKSTLGTSRLAQLYGLPVGCGLVGRCLDPGVGGQNRFLIWLSRSQGTGDLVQQHIQVQWLFQKVPGSQLDRADSRFNPGVSTHHDHGQFRLFVAQILEDCHAIFAGKPNVE